MREGRKALELQLAQAPTDWAEGKNLPNGWSLKDLLLHLLFWERRGAILYAALAAGKTPVNEMETLTIDQLNARAVTEGQARPYHDVLAAEREAYHALLHIAEVAPEADLFDPARFAWTEGKPFADWLAMETYNHYSEHTEVIHAALLRMELPIPDHWQVVYLWLLYRTGKPVDMEIMSQHLQYQLRLQASGQALGSGGVSGVERGDLATLTLLHAGSQDEAEAIANADPLVQIGEFRSVVLTWYLPAGKLG
jgi:uncharacterized protein YciI